MFFGISAYLLSKKTTLIEPIRAFYFWENTRKDLTKFEKETIKDLKVKKIYLKFFEIEKDRLIGIIPTAKSELHMNLKNSDVEVIPTIYVRNEVFKNVSKIELQKLAKNLNKLVVKRFKKNIKSGGNLFNEIQIDCDWTESTHENYFQFLNYLKELTEKQISATLRLYAYKFPNKMGVLPVDRAMLMCYNLIQPMEAGNRNSILDINELKKYLVGAKKYPLPLDVALPIYSSIQLYTQNKMSGIFYDENRAFVKSLKRINGLWYTLQKDTTIHNMYLRKGDKLKYELITKNEIQNAIKIIQSNVSLTGKTTIAFYHLSETEIKNYSYEELDNCYSLFIH